jgi:hypothetical protein
LIGEVAQADAELTYGEVKITQLGWTLMHLAAWTDQSEVVEHLLKLGFDGNAGDVVRATQHGHTPLKLAQILKHDSVCTSLSRRASEVKPKQSPDRKLGETEGVTGGSSGLTSMHRDKSNTTQHRSKTLPENVDERVVGEYSSEGYRLIEHNSSDEADSALKPKLSSEQQLLSGDEDKGEFRMRP